MLGVEIAVECAAWENAIPELESFANSVAQASMAELASERPSDAEVSLLFCDDLEIQKLNARWRKQDKPTNVLSFPSGASIPGASARLLGDIAIAFETVARESSNEQKSLRDHTAHMIVHGLLHLLGYDHEAEAEAESMEGRERAILARLGIPDPFRDREAS